MEGFRMSASSKRVLYMGLIQSEMAGLLFIRRLYITIVLVSLHLSAK